MAENTEEKPLKIDAVRQILAERGKKIKPIEISAEAKRRFDMDISPGHASNLKSRILTGRLKKKRSKKPAAPKEEAPVPVQPKPDNGKTVLLEDMEVLEGLIARIGAAELRRLLAKMAGR